MNKLTKILLTALMLISLMACPALAGNGDGSGGGSGNPLYLDSSTVPDGSTDVDTELDMTLVFSKNVVNLSVKENNMNCFSMSDKAGNSVPIQVIMGDDQVDPNAKRIINIVASLAPGTEYQLVISAELSSKSGDLLGEAITIGFTTAGSAEASEPVTEPQPETTVTAEETKPAAETQPETTVAAEETKPAAEIQPKTTVAAEETRPAAEIQPKTTVAAEETKPAAETQPKTTVAAEVTKPAAEIQPETTVAAEVTKPAAETQTETATTAAAEETKPAAETQPETTVAAEVTKPAAETQPEPTSTTVEESKPQAEPVVAPVINSPAKGTQSAEPASPSATKQESGSFPVKPVLISAAVLIAIALLAFIIKKARK